MKKKLTIVGVIVAVALLAIIGNKIYIVHQENVAKEKFLEMFSDLESKDIEIWSASKHDISAGVYLSVELKEEQKEVFCTAMKSVVPEEITVGKRESINKPSSFFVYAPKVGEWLLKFDGEAVYIVGSEEGSNEIYREWPWEIRNKKLNEFFSALFE